MKKELFHYVHELLSQKEHIIVPNFGAFVLQKTTTFLNDGEYISIIFSAQQQNDDKVLSNYISKENSCSVEEADEFIEQTLESVYSEIEQNGTYKINGIGEFRAINERIVFKPFDEQFLIVESVEATPVKEEIKAEIKEELKEEIKEVAKVDIETIRQTYAERTHQPKKEEETTTVEKEIVTEKVTETEKNPIDLSKFKTPLIILIIIAVLGITGYVFRSEIASLCKPTQTNDTTSVVTQQNINQLADTLQDIENTPAQEISSTENSTNENNAVQNTVADAPTEITPNTIPSDPIASPASTKTYYGNTNETKYYVTKAAYAKLTDATAEKNNLDHTGFIASIVETEGAKKYHVVVAEFLNLADAEKELNFAKQIDNRFYLMTVKPRNK